MPAPRDVREAVLRVAVMHPQKAALELFAREIAPAGTSWSPGTTGADGRPRPAPAIKQFAFLLDKAASAPEVVIGDAGQAGRVPAGQGEVPLPVRPEPRSAQDRPADVPEPNSAPIEFVEVPLDPRWPGAAAATRATAPTSASSRAAPNGCRCCASS